jgi:hypothetical protein
MQFLHPLYFLLSIFIAVFILFYFFRKQYEEKIVSANFLWEQALNEWQASPWLKKLQQNLLFWLQLIALLLLMLALVRPFWVEDVLKGEHIIMIIDSSATMSAAYENSTRFAEAKKEALELADKLGGQEVTLIKTGDKPEILASRESDPQTIKRALEEISLSYKHEEMNDALNLASSLSAGKEAAVYIFSDTVTEKQVKENLKDQYVEVHNIGEELENLSLLTFGTAPVDGSISGIAVVENQGKTKQDAEIRISSENEILFKKTISIASGEQYVLQIPSLPEKPYYEAEIAVEDGYSADNTLSSIFTNANPPVYSLGNINTFAVRGLQNAGVEMLQTEAGASVQDLDGVVVAENIPLSDLPKTALIVFNHSEEKIQLTEKLQAKDDPLLQYVNFEKVFIQSASKEIEGDWDTLLSSGDIPLIQKGTLNGKPIIILNFSLAESDWPLQPGFPIFLYNSYQWLSQSADFLGYFASGEEKWLNIGQGNGRWEIFNRNDQNLYTLDLTKESFRAPLEPGIYQAVSENEIVYFSVQLDDREKQANVQPAFKINSGQSGEKGRIQTPNDKLWFILALIALALIAMEWEVFRRGHRI